MTSYHDFFTGSATIAGALVGLLFVALSIQPERNRDRRSVEHQAVAGTAFTALVDALFISLIGLQPGSGLQYGALVFGAFGLVSSVSLGLRLWRARPEVQLSRRWLTIMLFIIAVYATQFISGLVPMSQAGMADRTATFIYVMFGMGIARAWELLGLQGDSIIDQIRGPAGHANRQPLPGQHPPGGHVPGQHRQGQHPPAQPPSRSPDQPWPGQPRPDQPRPGTSHPGDQPAIS